ncbi:hypothetical protein DN752_19565 [Echinicola strongylocentroti]|uniref:Uncharacterized protein n=1 Tax=Echinicola strongylocentroti TaxID=1795355 RepID=A0A2Z4IN47_9BACT|nr:hypothetical protein [Echinicola strongylocentroti]AWW32160.1 hypothetical protein DN752_19565 [Echinicola strongylocentroti]
MAKYRHVHCEFWNDEKVELEMTPEDKYLMLYLLTNDRTNSIGIYPITFKRMAYQTGYSMESVNNIVERLERLNLIKYDHDHKEICILNWGKWNLKKGGKPVEDAIKVDLQTVKNKSFISILLDSIDNKKLVQKVISELGHHDTSTIRPRYVDKTETETETETEKENKTETEKENQKEKREADKPPIYESLLSYSFKLFSESSIEGVFFEKMKQLHELNDEQVSEAFVKWKAKKEAVGEEFKTKKHLKNSFNKFLDYNAKEFKSSGGASSESFEDLVAEMERHAAKTEGRRL